MSINFRLAAGLLGVFVLTACMGTLSHPVEIPPEEVECDENGNKVCTQTNAAAQPAGGMQDSEFVNYTKVAADYREYGKERRATRILLTAVPEATCLRLFPRLSRAKLSIMKKKSRKTIPECLTAAANITPKTR